MQVNKKHFSGITDFYLKMSKLIDIIYVIIVY